MTVSEPDMTPTLAEAALQDAKKYEQVVKVKGRNTTITSIYVGTERWSQSYHFDKGGDEIDVGTVSTQQLLNVMESSAFDWVIVDGR